MISAPYDRIAAEYDATHIASRGHRLVGVDASPAMLSLARQRLPGHRWIHDRIENVELDESFGAVVCWDALFHLPRRWFEPVIRKVHQWLEPDGGRDRGKWATICAKGR